jgi:peptidoglycan/LPS O-acetylase OafA/YrhL
MEDKIIKKSFPALDGFRGIAAVIVFLFHLRSLFLGYSGYPAGDGYLAVDIFFALSGFVLAHSYLSKFQHGMSVFEFVKKRIVRLYPLYFLGLVIGSILFISEIIENESFNYGEIIKIISLEIFFLPAKAKENSQLFPINNVAWSLFFELIVNFVFVLFWKYINNKSLKIILITSGSLFFVYIFNAQTASIGNTWQTSFSGLLRTVFSFSMGLLVHNLYSAGKLRFNVKLSGFFIGIFVLVAYLVMPIQDSNRILYDIIFIAIISPALLVVGINVDLRGKVASVFSFLGMISYALYCLHYPILLAIPYLTKKFFAAQSVSIILISIISVPLFLLISYLSVKFYDVPIRKILMSGNIFQRKQVFFR